MKVAVVGGGGFRTPTVWESLASVAAEAGIVEVVLQDVSGPRLERIAAVIDGLRAERDGWGPRPRTTTSLEDALRGAGVVLCAIRVGGLEGRIVDETVPLHYGVLGQETVGPGGIAFALRTVPVMLEMARVASRLAPDAWFLNFTNPAGLVTEALRSVLGTGWWACATPRPRCAAGWPRRWAGRCARCSSTTRGSTTWGG